MVLLQRMNAAALSLPFLTQRRTRRKKNTCFLPPKCIDLDTKFFQKKIRVVFLPLKKCIVLQVNDAAVRIRLVVFVSKIQIFYIQVTEQTRRGTGERKGVPPL